MCKGAAQSKALGGLSDDDDVDVAVPDVAQEARGQVLGVLFPWETVAHEGGPVGGRATAEELRDLRLGQRGQGGGVVGGLGDDAAVPEPQVYSRPWQ